MALNIKDELIELIVQLKEKKPELYRHIVGLIK
jgi:hypothetical protein